VKTLTIIDTFGFFFRSYFALPPLKNKNGFPTGLLTGFVNLINSMERDYHSDYLLFAMESKEENLRKKIDPSYKAQRPEAPDDLRRQLPVAIDWIEKMGLANLSVAGYEADDIIASIAHNAREHDIKVRIVSHDKDLYQLIDDGRVFLFDPIKKVEIDEAACIKKYGVHPKDFVDFQSIVGDSADNVPGVKGIGQKGAEKLINEYKNLENIYKNLENITPERTKNLLLESKDAAFRSRELVRLERHLFDTMDLESFKVGEINPLVKITEELLEYDMNQAVAKIKNSVVIEKPQEMVKKKSSEFSCESLLLDSDEKLKKAVDALSSHAIVAFDTETTALDVKEADIVGFSFSSEEGRGFYVPISHNYLGVGDQVSREAAKAAVTRIFEGKVVGHNLKFDMAIIENTLGLENLNFYGDSMILAWLLNPESAVGLDNLMKRFFSHEMISFKDTVKKGEDFSSVEIERACDYAAEDAAATLALYNRLEEELKNKDSAHLLEEAKDVEFPFVKTLIEMEREGIKVDIDFFENLLAQTNEKLANLTANIYEKSGSEFNINSTQQLGVILFETLGLKSKKKTKTGYSTDEKVLRMLEEEHEIIPLLLEYRELFKLKSTYIEPLLKYGKNDKDNRVFTSFLQTGTATGRLSSKNPNLQNIPVKTEVGRKIREGFVSKDGYSLISLDYSQIELRLLAHFSQDSALVDAFTHDKDIHLETSTKIFGEALAQEKRNIAKSINFGLLYGMGARKLGETLKIPQKEAKTYIDSYFQSFPTVKSFIKSIEDSTLQSGYSETLLGRRRYFSFEGVAEYQKGGFLREAVNTVFQGSAADLIKLSMNAILQKINKNSVKMLLQVHDELIFEAEESHAKEIAQELKEIMENIHKLNVPLRCGVSIGKNWGELK